jgi:hypothetical protein
MPIRTLFVANRGEIAVRIIRAAKALGMRTVQAVSSADREMLAARMADEIAEVGPPHATKSYLNKEAVVAAAVASGADAVHPGYGFLSENADFAAMVESAGLVFVGPRPETIRAMGDKAVAREMAARAGVPTVPGSNGRVEDAGAARWAAEAIGYPLMIKAAAGGGGRGIRIAESPAELEAQIPQASAEALAASRSRKRAPRRSPHSGTGVFTSSVSSRALVISRFRSSGMERRRSISTSANARCRAAGKRSGRRRLRAASRQNGAKRCAPRPCGWRKASVTGVPARWNISTTRRPATSISSR